MQLAVWVPGLSPCVSLAGAPAYGGIHSNTHGTQCGMHSNMHGNQCVSAQCKLVHTVQFRLPGSHYMRLKVGTFPKNFISGI